MLTKQVDSRERVFRPIPISYLIQTANQFDCDIFVTSDKYTANVKQYDEVKNLRMTGFLTFYFKEVTSWRPRTGFRRFCGRIMKDKERT